MEEKKPILASDLPGALSVKRICAECSDSDGYHFRYCSKFREEDE